MSDTPPYLVAGKLLHQVSLRTGGTVTEPAPW